MDKKAKINGRISQIDAMASGIKSELSNLNKELTKLQKERKELESKLEALNREERPIEVSDHAVMRYIERFMGVEIELIKTKIAEEITIKSDGKFPIGNGCRAIVKDGVVVTVT